MTQILYGFIQDEATKLTSRMDTSAVESDLPQYGSLHGEARNYIVNQVSLNDSRDIRMAVLGSKTARGKLSVLFDGLRFDAKQLDPTNLTVLEQNCLFNIIERVLFRSDLTDEALETALTGNSEVYQGYVPQTVLTSEMFTADAVTLNTIDKQEYQLRVPKWIEFEFTYSTNKTVLVHLWYSLADFKTDYPYITITRVITPIKLDTLINPDQVASSTNFSLLTTSSAFIFDETNLETIARDQNGVRTYFTKYVINENKSVELPFALVYCGAREPQPLECRSAIKQFIEENTEVSKEYLKSILPELFISHRFYMVPLWDLFTERPEREVFNSIWSLNTLREKAEKVYRNVDPSFRETYLEVLTQAQSKTVLLSLPDEGNEEGFSLLERYPTYQDYSSQSPGWKYMSAEDQDFAGKVIRGMAVLNGELLSNEFNMAEYGSVKYLSFISGGSECFIMTKDSYLKLINV